MDKMKEKILEYYNAYGSKHYTMKIKKDFDLYSLIQQYKIEHNIETDNISEICYRIVHNYNPLCEISNKKRSFVSFDKGFLQFCGKANQCECCRKSVSENVSKTKALDTDEQKQETNKKREETNKERYGAFNIGQTEYAREKHKEFYENYENVQQQIINWQETMIKKWGVKNPRELDSVNEKIKETLLERYDVDNPGKMQSVRQKTSERMKQLVESGKFLQIGYDKFKQYLIEIYNVSLLTEFEDYNGCVEEHKFKCNVCGNEFIKTMDYRRGAWCKICHPTIYHYASKEETQVYDFIKEKIPTIRQSDWSLINPFQLDMIIPDKQIAIEYSGLYWHSEISGHKDKNYHKKKMDLCASKNYRLITIFSDEWLTNELKVKTVLSNILGFDDGQKINARECKVVKINNTDANAFHGLYHLLGSPNNSAIVNYGLLYEDSLYAIMSFENLRISKNKANWTRAYELTRYCTIANIRGGASKLFHAFLNEYDPNYITTYADLRWSQGGLYYKLGFKYEYDNDPNYWYVENFTKRYHRFNFRKDVLIESGAPRDLTEWQIMQSLGYDRIWDCGTRKFTWEKV